MFYKVISFLLIFTLCAVAASAKVKVTGQGDRLNFDPVSIPENMKPNFSLMNKKCGSCHSMEMIVTAVQTGICPITKQPFDRQAVKAYGIKMIRKKDADINKKEMRDIVYILNYLLDEQAR